MQTQTLVEPYQYRLAWVDTDSGEIGKGTFLFDEPEQAKPTLATVRKQFPSYHVWIEDRECNEIKLDI